jgi:hypothetical protein
MSSIHELTATVRAPAYALSGADGQIVGGMHGVFVDDLRVLSEARLQVDGVEPQALTAVPEGAGRTRFVSVAPALGDYDDPDPTVRLERLRVITPDGMWEEIHLRSTATRAVHAIVTVDLRCDLAPLAALRAGQTRPALAPRVEPQRLVWTAEEVSVTATADAVRPGGDPGRLQWAIDLPPGGRVTVQWILRIAGRTPLSSCRPPVEWARPGSSPTSHAWPAARPVDGGPHRASAR